MRVSPAVHTTPDAAVVFFGCGRHVPACSHLSQTNHISKYPPAVSWVRVIVGVRQARQRCLQVLQKDMTVVSCEPRLDGGQLRLLQHF